MLAITLQELIGWKEAIDQDDQAIDQNDQQISPQLLN